MSHDLLAELAGYQAELARHEQQKNTDRAEAVRGEIDRVIGDITERIGRLLDVAEDYESDGQSVLAAQARMEARRLADGMPAQHRPERLRALYPAAAGAETAAAAPPPEAAVPPAKRGGKPAPKTGA